MRLDAEGEKEAGQNVGRRTERTRRVWRKSTGLAGPGGRVWRPATGVLRERGVDEGCVVGVACKRGILVKRMDVGAKGSIFWKNVSARKGVG